MSVTAIDPVFALVLRAGLTLLFGKAAWHKLRDVPSFERTLRNYRLMPGSLVPAATRIVCGFELSVAGLLWIPGAALPAAVLAGLLLVAYSAAIALNLLRGRRRIDCGCLGPSARQEISGALIGRNALLLVAPLALLLPEAPRSLGWIDLLTIVAGLATVASIFIAANQLLAITTSVAHSESRS